MVQSILILYASETGTAQDMAEQIWRDAKRSDIVFLFFSLFSRWKKKNKLFHHQTTYRNKYVQPFLISFQSRCPLFRNGDGRL